MAELIVICARGGSKGLPNKNLKPMHGKPLIMWTVEQALGYKADVCVSSDSRDLLDIVDGCGIDIIERPKELAQDDTSKIAAIRHAVSIMARRTQANYTTIIDLDCTNPVRNPEDIGNSIKKLHETGASVVVSAVKARKNPYFNILEDYYDYQRLCGGGHTTNLGSRQEAPQCWDMNASITVFEKQWLDDNEFAKTPTATPRLAVYEMPPESAFDIDNEFDWKIVEWLMKTKVNKELGPPSEWCCNCKSAKEKSEQMNKEIESSVVAGIKIPKNGLKAFATDEQIEDWRVMGMVDDENGVIYPYGHKKIKK